MKNNFAIYTATLLLGCYITLLIAVTSYGQSQLLEAQGKEIAFYVKAKSKTLEYFLDRSKEEVKDIANSKLLDSYFANKALGMSMKYGLRASLIKIDKQIKSSQEKQKINKIMIFKDIVILDESRVILATTNKTLDLNKIDFNVDDFIKPRIIVKKTANKLKTTVVQAIRFKGKVVGYIVADINLNAVFKQLTQENKNSIFLSTINEDISQSKSDYEKIIVDVENTPFQLIAHLDKIVDSSILLSKWFKLLLIFLSIPIFITIYYLIRFNNKNIRLNSEVIFSKEKQNTLNAHNVELTYEIQRRKESENQMYHQANYDLLTTLPNRFLFMDRLSQAIKSAKRKDKSLAVFFIDLDNFKNINDSLGHAAGDTVLKNISNRLLKLIRASDTASRLGGDEFTIIVTEFELDSLSSMASKIIESIQEEMIIHGHKFYITSSIGISIYPQDGLDTNILLRNADSAMYKAKDDGKNRYKFYTKDMTSRAFEYIEMESSLRHALDNKEFVLHYQPQFNSITNKIIGMEALVRWNSPKIGMVPPNDFIPLAENSGLIVPLGEQILEMAISQIALWKEKYGLDGVRMAINLSVKQIENTDIKSTIENVLTRYSCKPEWIELEVTESYIMKNPTIAIETLKSLKDLGINISIDDFGTGYSSLSYLKKLPINKLKIDRSFVKDIQLEEDDRAIVESIILLASSMKLEVLAEGVEEIEQKEFLEQNGCINIQGYLYSRPLPADDFEKLLNADT